MQNRIAHTLMNYIKMFGIDANRHWCFVKIVNGLFIPNAFN